MAATKDTRLAQLSARMQASGHFDEAAGEPGSERRDERRESRREARSARREATSGADKPTDTARNGPAAQANR